jgi:hypothetical protein
MGLGSGIRDPGSGINLPRIPDLGQKGTGSRIRIRNTATAFSLHQQNIFVYLHINNKIYLLFCSISTNILSKENRIAAEETEL